MNVEDVASMKAAELRAELKSRSLSSKGDKAALAKRLRKALQGEDILDISDTSNLSGLRTEDNSGIINGSETRNEENVTANVETRNRYLILDDLSDADHTLSASSVHSSSEKKMKIPPLFVSKDSTTAGHLINKLKALSREFKVRDVKDFFKIEINQIEHYRNAIKMFDNENFKYHTYRLPSEKTIDVVIKHLPVSIGDNEIQNELLDMGFTVHKLMRVWNKNKVPIPVVNVYLDRKNPKNKEIYNIDRLLFCMVSVEPRKKSFNIPQCNNCQRYGHTRNYCKLQARCMFCAGNHESQVCTRDKTELVCIHCQEAHSANFKGCRYYQELKSRRFNKYTTRPKTPEQLPAPPPNVLNYPSLSPISSGNYSSPPRIQDLNEHSYARATQNFPENSNNGNALSLIHI